MNTTKLLDLALPTPLTGRAAVGLLLLRVYAGAALMQHGAHKITNPLHWMGDGPGKPAAILQALAAVSEYLGGLALILGLVTPLAALGIACTMAYATWVHVSRGDPFVGRGASFEPALGYLVSALLLMLAGPGAFSLDALLARKLRPRL
jgi:putative oxidoreductase